MAELKALLAEERAKNINLQDLINKILAVRTSGDLNKVRVDYENFKAEYLLKDLMKDISGIDRAFISKPLLERNIKLKCSNLPVIVIGGFNHFDLLDVTIKATLELNRGVEMLKYRLEEWVVMLDDKQPFAVKAEAGPKIVLNPENHNKTICNNGYQLLIIKICCLADGFEKIVINDVVPASRPVFMSLQRQI